MPGDVSTSLPHTTLPSDEAPPLSPPPPPHALWDPQLRSQWRELREVDHVERVLSPLFVTLIALSNVALLAHEARVVWRTQKLIPPKLLVLALCSADLLATLVGFLPLWVLFLTSQDKVSVYGSSSQPDDEPPADNRSHTPDPHKSAASLRSSSSSSLHSSTAGSELTLSQPVLHTPAYSILLFLLTSFWTLAQGIVVVMGVERLLALRAPYFYSSRCTCLAFLVVLGAVTLVSCGVGGFHLAVQLKELQQEAPLVFAGFLDSRSLAHNVFTLVQGLAWTLVLLACNWAVTRELRRMEQCVTVMRMKDQSEYMKQLSMVHGAGREFARFMMAVNLVFLLSSCPNLVCVLLRLCGTPPTFSSQYFCWRMSHISALLNPFLYGFLRKSLRMRIRRCLNQHVPCLRPQRVADADMAGPSARRDSQDTEHHPRPDSTIMPRDPEASLVHSCDD